MLTLAAVELPDLESEADAEVAYRCTLSDHQLVAKRSLMACKLMRK